MSKFIGYTCGLMSTHENISKPLLVKAEYTKQSDGKIKISAVNAQNLGAIHKARSITVSCKDYDERPQDIYDSVVEARWALGKLGFSIGSKS